MQIWVITWGDGCECNDVFVEAWTDRNVAEERWSELNMKEKNKMCGYNIVEYELNSKVDYA